MLCNHGQFFRVFGACSLALVISSTAASAQDPLENATVATDSVRKATANEKGTAGSATKTDAKSKANIKPEFILKSPAEWRRILTKIQFAVTREKHTEQPFAGKYASGHYRGMFVCVCCDAAHIQSELFSSQTKFDSGTGWPSFYQAISNKAVQTAWDYSDGEPRLEVMCRRCGSHLGHVFDDGPHPTGLRFCINSASIKLVAPDGEGTLKSVSGKTLSKSKSRSKSKAKARPGSNTALKGTATGESTDTTDKDAPTESKTNTDSVRRTSES